MGMNTVTICPHQIKREWHEIRVKYKVTKGKTDEEIDAEIEALENGGDTTQNAGGEQSPCEPEQVHMGGEHYISKEEFRTEVINDLTRWLNKGLDKLFNGLLELKIDTKVFSDVTELTAEILQKYNPDLSFIQILSKYKLELKLIWSVGALLWAVKQGFKLKSQNKVTQDKPRTIIGELVNE